MSKPISIHPSLWDAWRNMEALAGGTWKLPKLEPVWVSASRPTPADQKVCEQALRAAEDDRGWLRYQSAAFDGRPTGWRGDQEQPGRLLWAEWTEGERSHRVTPDPRRPGELRMVAFEESAAERAEAGWFAALAEEVELAGHASDRPLIYRVYWGATEDDPAATRRLFSRFVGFGHDASSAGVGA